MSFDKRAQTFAIDLTFGVLIMTGVLLSVVLYLPEQNPPFTHDQERMQVLMTEGVPSNWNSTNVIVPGFLSDGRFNQTKIDEFASLSLNSQKSLLSVSSSFTITFSQNGVLLPLCGTCGALPATYKNVLPIRRTGILNSSITTMEVLLYS